MTSTIEQSAKELFLEVRELFNSHSFKDAAELFIRYDEQLSEDLNKRKEFNCYRFIRICSLIHAGDEEAAINDIELLNDLYSDDMQVMDGTRQLMEHLGYPEFIFLLRPTLKTTVAAQARYAKEQNDPVKFLELCARYQDMPNQDYEGRIVMTIKEINQQFILQPEHLEKFEVDNDLPNSNYYINFEFNSPSVFGKASLPGPENDGICEMGSVDIEIFDQPLETQKFSIEISRNEINDLLFVSPFGIEADTTSLNIKILNMRYLTQRSKEDMEETI